MDRRKDYSTTIIRTTVLVVSLMVVIGHKVSGQDAIASDIVWTVNGGEDVPNGEKVAINCQFIKKGKSIEWIQKNGAFVQRYNITSYDGIWSDMSVPGKITYRISGDDVRGKIVAERTNSDLILELDLAESNAKGIHFKFWINSLKENK